MQLDIGHAVHAGADPVAVMKRYPGRAKTVHVKDYSPTKRDALIGDGDVKWKEVLATCQTVGGTEWYIIEEESNAYPGPGRYRPEPEAAARHDSLTRRSRGVRPAPRHTTFEGEIYAIFPNHSPGSFGGRAGHRPGLRPPQTCLAGGPVHAGGVRAPARSRSGR